MDWCRRWRRHVPPQRVELEFTGVEQLRRRACLLLGLTRLFVRAHRSVGESRKPPLQIHLLPTECRQLRAQFAGGGSAAPPSSGSCHVSLVESPASVICALIVRSVDPACSST